MGQDGTHEDTNNRPRELMSAGSSAAASCASQPPKSDRAGSRQQLSRDDGIRTRLMHSSHEWAFGIWQDKNGDVKSCGLNVPDRDAMALKLVQTMKAAASKPVPATHKFSAPEDAFWGGKLVSKQIIQLFRTFELRKTLTKVVPSQPSIVV